MRRPTAVAGVLALCMAAVGPAASQPPMLVPVDLGTLTGGAYSRAHSINDRGQVAGVSDTATGVPHAFLWERGVLQDLGSLGGGVIRTFINKRGQVAGTSYTTTGEAHAFLWTEGSLTDVGTLGGTESSATDLNNRGQVVGWSRLANGEIHAFLFEEGVMTDLGTSGENSRALDINERGAIAGSIAAGPRSRAVVWDRGTVIELGTLPGDTASSALGINQRGEVVGISDVTPGSPRAFFWRAGTMADLGTTTIGGVAFAYPTAINDRGQVAGFVGAFGGPTLGYFWEDGVIVPLTIAGRSSAAFDINDRGQVIGDATGDNANLGFVWEAGRYRSLLPLPDVHSTTTATAINKRGQVAGTSGFGTSVSRAVIWETGKPSGVGVTP